MQELPSAISENHQCPAAGRLRWISHLFEFRKLIKYAETPGGDSEKDFNGMEYWQADKLM